MTARVIGFAAEVTRRGRPAAAQRELFPRPAWAVPRPEDVARERHERRLLRAEELLAEGRAVRVLDLFSCIGGHALGLHAAGPFETVQFVEYDPWRRKVLARHFPGVPIHDDVRTFRGTPGSVEVVVGGPPCQRTSLAAAIHGYRTGASLWPDMLRIVGEVGPSWVVVEQPPGNRAWEAEVARGLAGAGYHASRLVLSAEGLGAPHTRRRVFVLANRDLSRLAVAGEAGPREAERVARGAADGDPWGEGPPGDLGVDDGPTTRMDGRRRRRRIEAIGDSNPPIMMAVVGRAILAAERCA